MDLPSRFNLLGRCVKVQYVKGHTTLLDDKTQGHWDMETHTIHLRKDIPQEAKEQAFHHELIHALLEAQSYNDLSADEDFVDRIGSALYQALKTMK